MPEIGAKEAKKQLAGLLERVRHGERFIITENGQPIAELAPVAEVTTAGAEDGADETQAVKRKIRKRGIRLLDV
ncbi:MAG: type II toxin-antitoxin system Phd/YefM family antitoxin [Thiotrichales bacterium]